MGSYIEEKIREMGYEGSSSTVRDYITDWKKRRKNITIKVGKMGQNRNNKKRKYIKAIVPTNRKSKNN